MSLSIIVLSSAGCTSPTTQSTSTNQTIDGITNPTTTGSPTPAEARQIAAAAYVYGYPLVFMDVWKDHQTAVPSPDLARGVAPINQLVRLYEAPSTAATGVAATYPSVDFSAILAWLNLAKEPMVLSVPAANGRYYVVQMEDAWMNDFSSLGSRTTGNGSSAFALVGPGWNGTLPSNVTKHEAPTNTVWMATRAQQNGPTDLSAAAAFLNNVTLTPLSAWGTNYTPPTDVPVNPSVNGTDLTSPASAAQVANMTPDVFYGRMATLMGGNLPHSADTPVIDQIARISIVPGKPFAWNSLNATMQNGIIQGYQDGISQVNAAAANWPGVPVVNGWLIPYNAGDYGTNYTLRAGMALASPVYNLPQDALYSQSKTNSTGVPYSGARITTCYTLRTTVPRLSTRCGRSPSTTAKAPLCPIQLTDMRSLRTLVT